MNTNKNFYPEKMTSQDRTQDFLTRRIILGNDLGFDGHKVFMADQKDKCGTWFEITGDYVEANPNGWSDINQDILIVTDKVPGVVIGHPVADCPVVIASDKKQGVTAIGHCSADLVNKRMPMLVADALCDAYRSNDGDISVYVGACAGQTWTYDKWPDFATDTKFWENYIILGKDKLYHIDLKKAVEAQLIERNIKNIEISPIDTITDDKFYSNSAAHNGNAKKLGRNFTGAFYKENNKIL